MGKYIAGDDLKGWADYAKGNSYQCDKAQLKAKLDADASGGPKGRENDWSDDWKQPQKDHEGPAARRQRPLRQTIPIPARAAASATKLNEERRGRMTATDATLLRDAMTALL